MVLPQLGSRTYSEVGLTRADFLKTIKSNLRMFLGKHGYDLAFGYFTQKFSDTSSCSFIALSTVDLPLGYCAVRDGIPFKSIYMIW